MKYKDLTVSQQLKIIEGICLVHENGNTEDVKRTNVLMMEIYKIAHLNGSCENPHEDWHKEGFRWIKDLKKQGICDVNEDEPRYLAEK